MFKSHRSYSLFFRDILVEKILFARFSHSLADGGNPAFAGIDKTEVYLPQAIHIRQAVQGFRLDSYESL